jgi:hypothetical protein
MNSLVPGGQQYAGTLALARRDWRLDWGTLVMMREMRISWSDSDGLQKMMETIEE